MSTHNDDDRRLALEVDFNPHQFPQGLQALADEWNGTHKLLQEINRALKAEFDSDFHMVEGGIGYGFDEWVSVQVWENNPDPWAKEDVLVEPSSELIERVRACLNTIVENLMSQKPTTDRYDKLQNAMHQLNADAYHHAAKSSRISYSPCPKAEVIKEAIGDGRPLIVVAQEAAQEVCGCHPSLTYYGQIHDMMFDDGAKKAHHAGRTVRGEA